jgi:pilus assembly protein CpaC
MAQGRTYAVALRGLVFLVCAGLLLALLPLQADAQSNAKVRRITGSYGGEMLIPIGKSELLGVDVEFERVSVGNSEVADVLPLSNQSIYVLGRQGQAQ